MDLLQNNLFVKNWEWQFKNSQAPPAFLTQGNANDCVRIKHSSLRTIYKIDAGDGKCYFLKHDHPASLFKKLRIIFKNKIKLEFEAALLLERCNIPVVNYLGWGRCGAEGMLVSEAVSGTVSGKEYWFAHACSNPELRDKFLSELAKFVSSFTTNRLYHPDFHSGNILVQKDTGKIILVDPYGIRQVNKYSASQQLDMYKIFVDFRGELNETEAEGLILTAGLADSNEAAASNWQLAVKAENDEVYDNWEKRTNQIISGKSKFCTAVKQNGTTYFIRHSIYYQPLFDTDNFVKPANLRVEQLAGNEARERWLSSFQKQLLRQPQSDIPLIWEHHHNQDDILYYQTASEGK